MMEQTNNSTDTLLASFQAGNMAAFSQLYDLHINILFNYGLKLTIDKELLKDCIHDIFVKLYTKKEELGTIDNLKSYLFISLKNKLCDELRKRMYMSDTAIEDVNAVAPTDVEDDYMEEEQRKNEFSLVKRLLDQLSPRQREGIRRHHDRRGDREAGGSEGLQAEVHRCNGRRPEHRRRTVRHLRADPRDQRVQRLASGRN